MSLEISFEGPLFDGRAARAMQDAADDAREDIAEFAEERVLTLTGGYFRNPTGYYESRIETTRVSSEVSLVHDNDVVYGPWLEGVGTRNRPRPGFPGYGHWRQTKQLVQARGLPIAERAVQRHLPEMRG
ncbi:hypothetical protein O3Q52_17460 [Streptomyces sp. ActVer]|uniref:hypothetical protein n=1 Tax=Streptomyces sp. ActVer TaxID=3014558 RepID=UPI0022B388DD|nr:hypothetical protein [Streptomyces sp. ActVer]MCZ4509953.1 hypothetical protein [Streptomyces sp. ActVer]